MKLSQKRNCNGCKAGYYSSAPFNQVCELGFKVKSENYKGIPLEPCYKPMTNDERLDASDIISGLRNKNENQ